LAWHAAPLQQRLQQHAYPLGALDPEYGPAAPPLSLGTALQVRTGRCTRTWQLGSPVHSVSWCPSPQLQLLAAAAGSRVAVVASGLGGADVQAAAAAALAAAAAAPVAGGDGGGKKGGPLATWQVRGPLRWVGCCAVLYCCAVAAACIWAWINTIVTIHSAAASQHPNPSRPPATAHPPPPPPPPPPAAPRPGRPPGGG